MDQTTKKASYLAGKSKTELIEDVKVLFALTCFLAFAFGFVLGFFGGFSLL
jgi:hypothetical protein